MSQATSIERSIGGAGFASFRSVPSPSPRYWAAMVLASVCGANLGDFVSHVLHLGHVRGVPFIAAAFALVVAVQRRVPWEGWYWLAVVLLRTIATNLADLATHDGKLGMGPVCGMLAALLGVGVLAQGGAASRSGAGGGSSMAAGTGLRTGPGYWLALLLAGTLGTALGDGIADEIGLGIAAAVTGLAVGLALWVRGVPALLVPATYWLAIVAIRTFGTNLGDMLAHGLGLAASTPLGLLALAGLLWAWRKRRGAAPG